LKMASSKMLPLLMLCAVAASPLLFTVGAPGTSSKTLRGSNTAAEQYRAFRTREVSQATAADSNLLGLMSMAAALGLVAGLILAPQAANAGTTKLGGSCGMGTACSFTEKEEPGERVYTEKEKEEIEKNKAAFKRYEASETKEERVARQMAKMRKIARAEMLASGNGDDAGVIL